MKCFNDNAVLILRVWLPVLVLATSSFLSSQQHGVHAFSTSSTRITVTPSFHPSAVGPNSPSTQRAAPLFLKIPFFIRDDKEEEQDEPVVTVTSTGPTDDARSGARTMALRTTTEEADVVIVGGGVAGLTAAIQAAESLQKTSPSAKIVLIEANEEVGGRVLSETTKDGFVLDKGFAVFIEEYPFAKKVLDYEALALKPFLPGALVKLASRNRLARVADPLRVPSDTLNAVLAPVGSLIDKIKVLPLIFNVRTKTIEDLFEEKETDTQTALTERWGFSEDFIEKFYKPFLEGIYLAPLPNQSSRMFSFVFKMFSEGSATLPKGGMGQVSAQLASKAQALGVDLRTSLPVTSIGSSSKDDSSFTVDCAAGNQLRFQTKSLIVATDGQVAEKLLSNVDGFENLPDLSSQPQRSVGCLYYSFKGPAPVEDPILILNGAGSEKAGTKDFPVNNVCFPSVVNEGYAPEGYNLCSVTILGDAMELYQEGDTDASEALDQAVRRQLGTWFQDIKTDILEEWELRKIYYIPNAQPSQYNGPMPANVNGGRPCNTYRGKDLPSGLLVCGDHMATATLNGALESGFTAGQTAAKAAAKAIKEATAAAK